jgi:hypothetical protein
MNFHKALVKQMSDTGYVTATVTEEGENNSNSINESLGKLTHTLW